jgi:hypothetical protein
MPDNAVAAGVPVATDEVTYSGDLVQVQLERPVHVSGVEGSRTVQGLTISDTDPGPSSPAMVVALRPQDTWVCSFASSGSSLLTSDFTQRRLGTGVTVSQSSGNLVLASGTTANSEFLARSTRTFSGAWIARLQAQLSQRIANQNFAVLLADSIGEGLSCTINSATSITVALPGHTFTADNVGQFLFVGAINGAAGVPGRYAIASVVAGTSITLTVAGWPASGSCTVDLFGWNWVRVLYTGGTATNAAVDAQRRGWNSGDTTATIQSTAAPGHIIQFSVDGRNAFWADALAASSATPLYTPRASRYANMPDQDVPLHVFIWLWNGTSAPASTTTWTIGFISVEDTVNLPVYLAGNRAQAMPLPVAFTAAQAVTISGTPTVTASGTVGPAAHDAAISGNPVRIAGRAVTANYTAVASGDVADTITTLVGAQVTKPYAIPEAGWNANLALTGTTAVNIIGAAGAGLKRHITAAQMINTGASAVEVFILDGTNERWRMTLPPNVPLAFEFPTELTTTAATALNVNLSAAGTVRFCAQGYTAP